MITEADIEVEVKHWSLDGLAKPEEQPQRQCMLWSKARNEALVRRSIQSQQHEAEETRVLRQAELQRLEEERLVRAKVQRQQEREEQAKQAKLQLHAQRAQAREERARATRTFHFDHAF